MKKVLLMSVAVFCSAGLFAMAGDCPEDAKKCSKEMRENCEKKDCKDKKDCPEVKCPVKDGKIKKADCPQHKQMKRRAGKNAKRKAPQVRRPRFKMSPEMKAEMEKFRTAVKAYKENKTPENKAALVAILGKQFDKRMEMSKKRAESLKKMAANIEKKNAEMQKNRDAEIEKMLERVMNPPKRRPRQMKKAPVKKAPAAQPAAKPAAKTAPAAKPAA